MLEHLVNYGLKIAREGVGKKLLTERRAAGDQSRKATQKQKKRESEWGIKKQCFKHCYELLFNSTKICYQI